MAIEIGSVSKPKESAVESAAVESAGPTLPGSVGKAGASDASHGASRLLVKGKVEPIRRPRFGPESVIGLDQRTRIVDTELAPWRMICSLELRAPGGDFIGTGWFVGPRTLITAGHCVFDQNQMGGWVGEIEVFPGRDDGHAPFSSVKATRFSAVDRWVNTQDPDFDVGAIHLDQPLGAQVGWFAVGSPSASELAGYGVNVSGYPGDKGGRQQWFHSNRILHVSDRRIFYDVDTYGGQSGGPAFVYPNAGADPLVVGIHAYGVGGTPSNLPITANSAPRIIPEVVAQIAEWIEQDG